MITSDRELFGQENNAHAQYIYVYVPAHIDMTHVRVNVSIVVIDDIIVKDESECA